MILKRPYVIIASIMIVVILILWVKSHETRIFPVIPDLDEEEKEIQLSTIIGQKALTLITFQNYKLKFGNLDLAQRLKQEVSQLKSVRDSTFKDVLLQHITVLEQLEKDTLFYEQKGFYDSFIEKDLYHVLEPRHTYKLLLEGKAEVTHRDKSYKLNEIKAMVRKLGNTDADVDVTFLTQKQDTIYSVVLMAFE